MAACSSALSGDTIQLADGVYNVTRAQLSYCSNITIRSASGDPTKVVLASKTWSSPYDDLDDILRLFGSNGITVADITFGECHAYGLKLESVSGYPINNITVRHCRFINNGTRGIKGTQGVNTPVSGGLVQYCYFENTKIPPTDWQDSGNYITSIDCMLLNNWTFADNMFVNIKGASGGARGAIFNWVNSQNIIIERNAFFGCDRSISLGNASGTPPHITNGLIRNNFIRDGFDTGIEICGTDSATGVRVYNNTIWTDDAVNGNAIHCYYGTIKADIRNNIIRGRTYGDLSNVTKTNNIETNISSSWFVNAATDADLHLTSNATPAIDTAVPLPEITLDWDGLPRLGASDCGADEFGGAGVHDMTRANSYDDGWQNGWIQHCRGIFRSTGKSDGFVLQIGDSITHSNPYSQWPRYGAGQTSSDATITAWTHAAIWDSSQNNTGSVNGWYLAAADTSGIRGMTASSGIDSWEYRYGDGNGGNPMPTDSNPVSAAAKVADGATYSYNLNSATVAAAFNKAQFAVLMLGTNDVSGGRTASDFRTNLEAIADTVEAQNIVVILSTIPPHYDPQKNAAVNDYNNQIRQAAQTRGLPLIDFNTEILLRRPGTSWSGTLIGLNDVHPTASNGSYGSASDPYANGGNAAANVTGDACLNVGYLLRSWLTVQKLKEVKANIVDSSGTAPVITTQPANQTVAAGQTATFSVVASGTAPLTYQWKKNGVAISGAISASYTTPSTTASDNGATFVCVVSNAVGIATSNPATLTVTSNHPPTITSLASATPNPALVGQTITFSAAASDADGDTLTYAWSFGDGASGSGSSATHAYASAGGYTATVTVSDGHGGTATSSVTVTVNNIDTTATATYVTTDTTTQGNWKTFYGADGYAIQADSTQNPSYGSATFMNSLLYTWLTSTTDVRAPLKAISNTDRIAACWYNSPSFNIDVNIADGQTHQVALYALDWDSTSRAESFEVDDAGSGAILDGPRTLTAFNGGKYIVWNIKGHVTIKVTMTGSINAVVSAIFFGGGSSPAAPVITSSASAGGTVGAPFNYTIAATNNPASFNATGFPAGLAVNTATGVISGTPTAAGTFNATISATNAGGTGTAALTLTINNSTGGDTFWVDESIPAGGVAASDGGDSWTWVSGNPVSGQLYQQSNIVAGEHQHYFYGTTQTLAVNSGESLIAYVYLDPSNPPSEVMLQWNDGSWEHRAYWGANNIDYGADGTASRLYMGPLPAAGAWTRLQVAASQVGLSGATLNGMAFTLADGRAWWDAAGKTTTSNPLPPIINSALTASGAVGASYSYTITATNSPTSFNATGLPGGLTVNTSSGVISGTPTAAGTANVTISAANSAGTGSATLVITINNFALPPPVINSALSASGTDGSAFSYAITATNSPNSYNATPLPAGLNVNTSTGVISGTPSAAGTTNVTISASNVGGTGSATLVITINNAAPKYMHIGAFAMKVAKVGNGKAATATITIVDAGGVAVSGATVSGSWSSLTSGSASGTTNTPGVVSLISAKTRQTGTFTFTVTSVSASGYIYDSASNVATSGSITTAGQTSFKTAPVAAATPAGAVDLGSVSINKLFKLRLPLPDSLAGATRIRSTATGLPARVRVRGGFIGGAPKQAGSFTITVQFTAKTVSSGTNGKSTVTTLQVTHQYTLTVVP
jgi:PKD repeat protein